MSRAYFDLATTFATTNLNKKQRTKKSIVSTVICSSFLTSTIAQDSSSMKSTNYNAPVFNTKTILINAKPEKIWAILTNIDEWNKWLTTVSKSKLNGALQPNTTFDWKTGGMKIHSTLHTVQEYSSFGWTGKVYGIYAIHNWAFKEVNGSTEVSVSESMEGFLATLFKKSFNKTLEKDMTKSLELLKLTCE